MSTENLIILAAGKPQQGDKPALLTQVNGQTLFDWQINALSADTHPQVVVGYAAAEFRQLLGRAIFYTNPKWETSGSGYSLFSADLSGDSLIVSYADILYRPALPERIKQSSADITIAYDSHWKQRFVGRTEQDLIAAEKVMVAENLVLRTGQNLPVEWAHGEFIGLVRFQGAALKQLQHLQKQNDPSLERLSLAGLVEWLRLQGASTEAIDAQGDWAELNEPKDIAHFILGTKAETLDRLSHMVSESIVLDQVAFDVEQWNNSPESILKQIQDRFHGHSVVVRSSAKNEDSYTHPNTGAYTSILNVDPTNGLKEAIITVIESYIDCQPNDQVLIQPMVQDVRLSGVAFTRMLEHGSPFYIINYDESGDTQSITSGSSKEYKSLYLRKDAELEDIPVDYLQPLVKAIKEVEQVLNYDALDIEFALDFKGQVYLLQARPIAAVDSLEVHTPSKHVLELQSKAAEKWQKLQPAAPQIYGDKALFAVMPDCNPAEIIGTNPGKLAVSLYEHLISNEIWATQRAEYGYRDVRPQALLRQFAGKPYIDIRASFNSFIPKELSDELAEKLANFYLTWLEEHPQLHLHLHDKAELDLVPTCFGPMFSKWENRLIEQAQFNSTEISALKQGLLHITQNAVTRTSQDMASLAELQKRHDAVVSNSALATAEKVNILLENCKPYGTLPCSHLAHAGFVAETLLREGVAAGWLTAEARDGFMETVKTVSQELSQDAWATAQGDKSWESFVEDYGHLRLSTYDISSPAYKDDPERFLKPIVTEAQAPKAASNKEKAWDKEKAAFFQKLRDIELDVSDEVFENFLTEAIEGREKARFIFTKSLSAALSLLEQEGHTYGLTTNELANLSLYELQAAFNSDLPLVNISEQLKASAKHNKYERRISHACQLPPLLTKPEDFCAFILTKE